MVNGIRSREVPASDGSTCAMLFIVVDDVHEVVEGKEATERSVASSADAVSPPPLTSTIMPSKNCRWTGLDFAGAPEVQ
jgi:hypothetical protein